jgi:hypothetical protein
MTQYTSDQLSSAAQFLDAQSDEMDRRHQLTSCPAGGPHSWSYNKGNSSYACAGSGCGLVVLKRDLQKYTNTLAPNF